MLALALAVTAALTLATAAPLRAADGAAAAAVAEGTAAAAAKVAPTGSDAAATAAAAAAASEKILRVATSGDYAPFSFSSSPESPAADGSDLRGFDVELARQFARDNGYRLEFVRFRWPELSKQMAAGTFDVAVGGITMRTERSISGRYSVPLVATHAMALTWKGSGVTNRMELDRAGRRVYVNAGGHLEHIADEAFRRAQVIPLADNDAVRMALLDRMGDAVVTDDFEQKVWTANVRGVVAIGPLSDDRKAWFLPPGNAELAAKIDRWLLAKERDGTLECLRTREFGPSGSDYAATATPVAAFATAVAERQALMPLVWAAKRKLGKPVEDKAQEAAVLDAASNALNAATAGQPAPDAEAARAVFEKLLVISKDTQQGLADRDSKRRPGAMIVRSKDGQAVGRTGTTGNSTSKPEADPVSSVDAAKTDAAVASGAAAPSAAPVKDEASAPVSPPRDPSTPRLYDLATELRPAIARITEKIARAMVAMEPAMSSRQATNALDEALTPGGTKGERIEVLVDALVVWSSRRPYAKP